MSRFLFLSLPLTGHVNPMVAVAKVLLARGHEVLWAGSESFLRPLAGPDAVIHPIPLRAHRGQAERGLDATRSRWEGYILPHTKHTRKGVEAAVEAFRPDLLVVDQHAIAGPIVAHRFGLPWVTVASSAMELTRPFARGLPKVEAWIQQRMRTAWSAAGHDGEPPWDLRFSPHLLISFLGEDLLDDPSQLPANTLVVGPSLAERAPDPDFPFDWLDPARRHVLVTMGTLNMDQAAHFYPRMLEAIAPLGEQLQAVVVAPQGTITGEPGHVLVRRPVPVLDLLPHLDAVVSHGGANTVNESLVHGVPLLVAPIKGDQALMASAVARAGAGLRVSIDHSRPAALRAALLDLLDDPRYAEAARATGKRLLAGGGADAAATALIQLASAGTPSQRTTSESEQARETPA
ncbi:glycosyltransferase family 1 protein [Dactylosporangium aurantiacum]|uniref:Glycosyltransferase family 1 protein n=1 Tax=Dactylosporangium aurantiacum TaxID=35754 RepID=A0A9Q9MHP8_9ACTN|nr:glycosyltransferase [Dactylosporangium aurantiacum]MDG6105675.1 glycosyltransferase [Dactylosporangium aurantiacum]UWZ56994.1 glycosyltransferase family 1 protein [Dactylosporangium aurantiacum]